MEKLYWSPTLHHIFKCTNLWSIISAGGSKVSHTWASIFRKSLLSNRRSRIISLIFVYLFDFIVWSACFRKCPPWEILFSWWVCWCFRNVSARANWSRSWSLILQSPSASSSEAKGILGLFHKLWTIFWEILGTRGCLKSV